MSTNLSATIVGFDDFNGSRRLPPSDEELRRRCLEFDMALTKARDVLARFKEGKYK